MTRALRLGWASGPEHCTVFDLVSFTLGGFTIGRVFSPMSFDPMFVNPQKDPGCLNERFIGDRYGQTECVAPCTLTAPGDPQPDQVYYFFFYTCLKLQCYNPPIFKTQ